MTSTETLSRLDKKTTGAQPHHATKNTWVQATVYCRLSILVSRI